MLVSKPIPAKGFIKHLSGKLSICQYNFHSTMIQFNPNLRYNIASEDRFTSYKVYAVRGLTKQPDMEHLFMV